MDPQKKSLELATSICKTLHEAGYTAYFAGGWVRDLLLNTPSDEIDIATSAPPETVQTLFPKTVPVGIAFGVVIIVLDDTNFEVTTFRKDHPYQDGRHPEGIDFSTPEKDAWRRDFTINGLFFDPLTEEIHDYIKGKEDLEKKIIRAIGDPKKRFEEDRLRMIRAVRFSARLGFPIAQATADAIIEQASTLFPSVSIERVWQELEKMSVYSNFDQALVMLYRFGLLQEIFPKLKDLPIEELAKRVSSFSYFPLQCPTIAYLMELFPDLTPTKRLQLCRRLKTSVADQKLVEFLSEATLLFHKQEVTPTEWAYFYAHPHSELAIQIAASHIMPPDRSYFIDSHNNRKCTLSKHITRLQQNKPLVTSAHLQEKGVQPGKKMGQLLKEAERIAIDENLTTAEEVLNHLIL